MPCGAFYCIALNGVPPHGIVLHCVAAHPIALQCTHRWLRCVALRGGRCAALRLAGAGGGYAVAHFPAQRADNTAYKLAHHAAPAHSY